MYTPQYVTQIKHQNWRKTTPFKTICEIFYHSPKKINHQLHARHLDTSMLLLSKTKKKSKLTNKFRNKHTSNKLWLMLRYVRKEAVSLLFYLTTLSSSFLLKPNELPDT